MVRISEGVREGMLHALFVCMTVVRRHQIDRMFTPVAVMGKSDSTIVTTADKESDRAGKDLLGSIPGIIVHGEESGATGRGEIIVYLDGLDGSMPFAIGVGTSTVIVAAVKKATGEVIYCMVGEPQTGRVWRAGRDGCCESAVLDGATAFMSPRGQGWREVHVCDDVLASHKSRVLVDSYPGFTKDKRTILSIPQLDRLHDLIQGQAGLLMLGSNGMHHALIANGGKGAVGAITTAIGGPWDVCPVLLVMAAGGFARAFSVILDATGRRTLEERNPHIVASYDIVISGNTQDTVDTLVDLLERVFIGD